MTAKNESGFRWMIPNELFKAMTILSIIPCEHFEPKCLPVKDLLGRWKWRDRHTPNSSGLGPMALNAPLLHARIYIKKEKILNVSYNVYCFHRRPQPKFPTLTSSLIMLCLIPQSTATTLIGLPFPNTWISLKQEEIWWTLTENAVTAI